MLKKLTLAILILLFSTKIAEASENFTLNANIEYKIEDTGTTFITHTITITNNTSYEYAKNYILELSKLEPKNIRAYEGGKPIHTWTKKDGDLYEVTLNFSDPIAGKDESRTFIVTYQEDNLTEHNGDVWEISIPKLLSKYDSYKVVLSVPQSFGEEAIISPEKLLKSENQERKIYVFEGDDIRNTGINAVFGKFQVYSIKLAYHITNPDNKGLETTIALPPDMSTQRVFYTKITPAPQNISVDKNGNWLAHFKLHPKEKYDVYAEGYVQVFSDPVKLLSPNASTILENLKPQKYWESDDIKISQLAKELKTAENIYGFVTKNLTYNYDRVKPDVERLGAKKSLQQTSNAICTEYTDLFIALSRAAGIPAREINGYAHSDNASLQPLSLISDVLHSWPEYWDEKRQNWIPVDPTWEATSKQDYFTKFDLKHIAFVIHGLSSTEPLSAGSYKSDSLTKDVFVEFSSLPEQKNKAIEINHKIKGGWNIFKKRLEIEIVNNKSNAVYNFITKVSYPESYEVKETVPVLPPFSKYTINVDIDTGPFAVNTPAVIDIVAENSQKTVFLDKTRFVTEQLLLFLSLLLILMIFLGIKSNKIHLSSFKKVINKTFSNAFKAK